MKISVPLLLWALFIKIVSGTMTASFIITIMSCEGIRDVGMLTTYLHTITSAGFTLIYEISFIINGRILCRILSQCQDNNVQKDASGVGMSMAVFTIEGVMTLVFCCLYLVLVSLKIYIAWEDTFISSFYKTIITFRIVWVILSHLSWMLVPLLFREVLTIAAGDLSDGIHLYESVPRGSVVELKVGSDPRLRAVERTIHKVS